MLNIRLKQLRKGYNLTQTDLANILNIAKTTLAAYEQGKSEPNINLLIKISNYFNVTVDYLIGNTDCVHQEYQPISDLLGIDEKTIEIIQSLSVSSVEHNLLDYLEVIIQHPQFPALLSHINTYTINNERGWHDLSVPDSNGNIINIIPAEVIKASSMQIIQSNFKGIIESVPYSEHFINRK